jgi:hypothetical protein
MRNTGSTASVAEVAPTSAPVVLSGAFSFARPHAHTRLRRAAGGGHEGIREELAAGVNAPFHEKKRPRASHWPSGAEVTGSGEATVLPTGPSLRRDPVSELGQRSRFTSVFVRRVDCR